MAEHPDHETSGRAAISGYYDKEMKSSDEKLGRCTDKADLDDWNYRASPINGVFDSPEDRALPSTATPTWACTANT